MEMLLDPPVYASPDSDLLFENTTFANHSSPVDSLIEIHNSKLTMIDCTIVNNKMGTKGGTVQATASIVSAQGCEFRNNSGRYGSLFSLSRMSKLKLEGSVVLYNTGIIGGCVYITDSIVQVKDRNI